MATTQTTTQAVSAIRSNYAALRRLAVSGGRTAATTNAVSRRRNAIEAAGKNLARDLAGELAHENTLLENIAASRRNGIERPELAARLADCRRLVHAKTGTRRQTKIYAFGDEIRFTNPWGQKDQIFTVISQDGGQVYGDYLGIGNLLDLTTMSIIPTDALGHPIAKD